MTSIVLEEAELLKPMIETLIDNDVEVKKQQDLVEKMLLEKSQERSDLAKKKKAN